MQNHQQLLIAADLTPFKDPLPPRLPHAVVREVQGDAFLGTPGLWLCVSQVIPDGSAQRGNQQKLKNFSKNC